MLYIISLNFSSTFKNLIAVLITLLKLSKSSGRLHHNIGNTWKQLYSWRVMTICRRLTMWWNEAQEAQDRTTPIPRYVDNIHHSIGPVVGVRAPAVTPDFRFNTQSDSITKIKFKFKDAARGWTRVTNTSLLSSLYCGRRRRWKCGLFRSFATDKYMVGECECEGFCVLLGRQENVNPQWPSYALL